MSWRKKGRAEDLRTWLGAGGGLPMMFFCRAGDDSWGTERAGIFLKSVCYNVKHN